MQSGSQSEKSITGGTERSVAGATEYDDVDEVFNEIGSMVIAGCTQVILWKWSAETFTVVFKPMVVGRTPVYFAD